MADIAVYTVPTHYISKHTVISNIMEKAAELSDFKSLSLSSNHYSSVTGNVAIGNGAFGGLFTCNRYEHVLKVVYG